MTVLLSARGVERQSTANVTLADEIINPEIYEVTFKGTNFSSGVYFYSLSVEGNTVSTKSLY